MLLASQMESASSSREEFHNLVLTGKGLVGIDRRKFLSYTGVMAASFAAPTIFDFGITSIGNVQPLLPQIIDDPFFLTELRYTKPNHDTLIQIVYADVFNLIMDIPSPMPQQLNSKVNCFEIFGACY